MLGDIPQTWDEVWALEPGVYSWVQSIPLEWQPEDTPSGALRVELSVHNSAPDVLGGTRSAMLSYIDGAANRTRYIGERTSSGDYWAKLATATPPQEFDLPLAEGVTPVTSFKNSYSKDQFGIVRVWFSVHFESIPASGTHVFHLPEGFRPDSTCCAAAGLSMTEYYNAIVAIHPSGDALVDHGTIGQSGPINLHGYIEFPAS